MAKKVTTIIFDWAGVFCSPGEPFSHPNLKAKTGLSIDEMGEKTKELQKLYYEGKISTEGFWEKVIKAFGLKNVSAEELSRAYTSSYKIYPEMLDLARNLKLKYKTAILSNMTSEMMKYIIKTHKLNDCFNKLFFSNQIRLMKPRKEAYEYALNRLGSLSEETLFIDDSATNVEAAKKLGINAFVFESLAQCKNELAKFGIDY